MRSALLSTAYLPPISWMAVAIQAENINIEIQETYPKQTFRNRCNIATSGGILPLSVPVMRVNGNHTKTADITIDNSKNWQQLHWRSIVTAYNKSPYFLFYRDLFEPVYCRDFDLLVELNSEIINKLSIALNIKNIDMNFTSGYQFIPYCTDLRLSFNPKKTPYQSITTDLPRYMQAFEVNHGYIPDLSIIDLLFNMGPDALQYLSDIKILPLV